MNPSPRVGPDFFKPLFMDFLNLLFTTIRLKIEPFVNKFFKFAI